MNRLMRRALVLTLVAWLPGCTNENGSTGSGGAAGTSGAAAVGGAPGAGGAVVTGGSTSTAGTNSGGGGTGPSSGGAMSMGGSMIMGGMPATGGIAPTGGRASTGGIMSMGGVMSMGGMMTTGGFRTTGGSTSTGGTGGAATHTITIHNFAYSPSNLNVPPGATVTVVNQDTAPHSVTSESAMNDYTPGAVNGVSFDTGSFASGTRTFTIPASASAGTVVPYYCSVHLSSMPQGTVTIQ
jgi:plastocyanin